MMGGMQGMMPMQEEAGAPMMDQGAMDRSAMMDKLQEHGMDTSIIDESVSDAVLAELCRVLTAKEAPPPEEEMPPGEEMPMAEDGAMARPPANMAKKDETDDWMKQGMMAEDGMNTATVGLVKGGQKQKGKPMMMSESALLAAIRREVKHLLQTDGKETMATINKFHEEQ